LPAEFVPGAFRVGREQRGDDAATRNLRGGLRQRLEEVQQDVAPVTVLDYLPLGVHHHFVHENERRQPFLPWQSEQVVQGVFGRCTVSFLGLTFRVHNLQASVTS
jgi:hypothetical protein